MPYRFTWVVVILMLVMQSLGAANVAALQADGGSPTPMDTPVPPSETPTPTETPTQTNTPVPTDTPTLTPTSIPATDAPTPTIPPTDTPTPTPSMTPTATPTPAPTSTPAGCWVPFGDDLETGSMSRWTSNSALTVQQAEVANGIWAAQGHSTAGTAAYARKTLSCAQPALYYQITFKIANKDATSLNLLKFRTSSGSIGGVYVSGSNRLGYRSDAGNFSVTSKTVTVSTAEWHTLEAMFDVDGQAVSIWYDGTPVADLTKTAQALGTSPIAVAQLGENGPGDVFTVQFDDVCIDTVACGDGPVPTPEPTATFTPTPTATVTPTPTATPTPTPTATTPGGSVTIMAAGDIACGATSRGAKCKQMETSNLLVNGAPAAVLPLGDIQYECGETADFNNSYNPSWGRVKNVTRPAVGNHEYSTLQSNSNCTSTVSGAPGYWTYFGDASTPLQPGCRVSCRGYYSYDVGAWHLIALNSNCSQAGGCGPTSPQGKWLASDLAAHPNACTLAYFHHPRFSSGGIGNNTSMDTLWQPLYKAGVDVILVGHDHNYERFAPQNPGGALDNAYGIRQFVVGTGGRNTSSMGSRKANSEVFNTGTFGVLEMTLSPTSYSWRFIPIAGQSFTDLGSGNCHAAPPTAGVQGVAFAGMQGGSLAQVSAVLLGLAGAIGFQMRVRRGRTGRRRHA